MKKPKPKGKSALNDRHLHQGVGLFSSNNDLACFDRIYEALPSFIGSVQADDDNRNLLNSLQAQKDNFLLVVRQYNADSANDDRFTFPEMKGDVRRVINSANRLQYVLTHLPRQIRNALNTEMRRTSRDHSDHRDIIQIISEHLQALEVACTPISKSKGVKRSRTCVVNACDRLWNIWETVCGREFTRTWTSAPGRPESAKEQFDNADARFVHAVLTAIDPDIRLSQVRDGLKQVAKARGKVKIAGKRDAVLI